VKKSHLVAYVAGELATSRFQAQRLVDTVLEGIRRGLQDDESVTLTGFGTFEVKDRKARLGRNPQTGEPIRIDAGRRVGFRVGKALKDSV
jgi:nucleoid DNA-binding protein